MHEDETEEEEERNGNMRVRYKDAVLVSFWFCLCGVVLVGAVVA